MDRSGTALCARILGEASPSGLAPGEWALIRKSALECGVAAPVAFKLRDAAAGSDREWCDQMLMMAARRHQVLLHQLLSLLDALSAADVEAVPLKGPVLAERRHNPPFTRRPSIDLDIAVQPSRLDAAMQVLSDLGYRPTAPAEVQKRFSHHVVHYHERLPRVELHFRLSHGARGVPTDTFIDRAEEFRLACGSVVRVLCPADELFHLMAHVSHSRYASLFHLHELRLVSESAGAAARLACVNLAIELGFTRPLRIVDAALRALWGVPLIPAGVALPRTWLDWVGPGAVYQASVRLAHMGSKYSLGERLLGRMVDALGTDSLPDALRVGTAAFFSLAGQVSHRDLRPPTAPGRGQVTRPL